MSQFLKLSLLVLTLSGLMIGSGYALSGSGNSQSSNTAVHHASSANNNSIASNQQSPQRPVNGLVKGGEACTYAYVQAYNTCKSQGKTTQISLARLGAGGGGGR